MGRRKLTDAEKNKRQQQKVDEAVVNKESQLEKFKERALPIDKETIDAFQIKPKPRISQLSSSKYMGFWGEKNYRQALEKAYSFEKDYNEDKTKTQIMVLLDYFPQMHVGKTIIVSYKLIDKKV